eukprot:5398980-Ditylum_brightwellii.AAC.1
MEVKTIPIQWIVCHIDDLEIDSGTKPVQQEPVLLSSTVINPAENTEEDPELEPVDHPIQQPKKKEQGSTSNISTSLTQEVPGKKVNKDLGFSQKETLGHCTDEVLAKTLENTTQYFPTCVESETHAYPVQHHQKQLFPLHLLQLKGRICTDMFFSSVKSIH